MTSAATTAGAAPRVAVIILNWNGRDMMRQFLPEVVANTPGAPLAEVVVADNGSTDGSIEMLRSEFPSVRILEFDENYGFAEGFNRAIALVESPYVVLLNSDVATDAGWLDPLVDYMDSHPDVGALQPKLLSYREPDKYEYAGAMGGMLDCNGYAYCRGRVFSTVEADSGRYATASGLDWATGACLMVRRELYLSVGGMDRYFFAHMEEIDLCWRIRLAGYKIAAVAESSVRHLGGGTLPAGNPRKTYLNFRNNLLLLHKNLPRSVRGRRLLARRLYDALAWAMFVATGQWGDAKALLKAHADFRRMRRRYDTNPQANLLTGRPNVVLSYYLKGKKHYSDVGPAL